MLLTSLTKKCVLLNVAMGGHPDQAQGTLFGKNVLRNSLMLMSCRLHFPWSGTVACDICLDAKASRIMHQFIYRITPTVFLLSIKAFPRVQPLSSKTALQSVHYVVALFNPMLPNLCIAVAMLFATFHGS